MSHLPEETLAGIALGEPDALSLRDRWHLSRCRSCATDLTELRQVVSTGRSGPAYPLRAPRPGLWDFVQAELDEDPTSGGGVERPVPVVAAPARGGSARSSRSRRTRWVAAAAGVAVVVGVAGTVAYRQTREDVVATAVLSPLPTKSGRGTAEMIRGRDGTELAISITTSPPEDRYEEVWLFRDDGQEMISVGIVPPDGVATFPVPDAPGALNGYTVVDVSLEPYDGNPAHSHNSILRGTLT